MNNRQDKRKQAELIAKFKTAVTKLKERAVQKKDFIEDEQLQVVLDRIVLKGVKEEREIKVKQVI
jgi:hypothetical protein